MDANEQLDEEAFLDFMGAREAALQGAAGYFTICNVPTDRIRYIARSTTNDVIRLAAQCVLFQRGEDWR